MVSTPCLPLKHKSLFISSFEFLTMVCTLLLSTWINGQTPRYTATWFTDSEGLPQNSIKDIAPDKYGYIWISTENGVIRYDGQGFKLYNNKNLTDFSNDRMLFFDGNIAKDSITISNVFGEELLITNHNITRRQRDSVIERDFIKAGAKKNPRNKIVDPDKYTEIKINGILRYKIEHDSIREFNERSTVTNEYRFSSEIGDQFFGLGNQLFVLKNKTGIFRIDKGELYRAVFNLEFEKEKNVFINETSGQVFLFTEDKIYLLKEGLGHIIAELILEDFDFASSQVYSMYYDPFNRISYIGSSTMGLCIVKEKPFQTILTEPQDFNKVEYSLLEINDSTLINPSGSLITNGKYKGKIKFQKNTSPYLMAFDKGEHIWVKEGDKLYRYDKENNYGTYDTWKFDDEVTALSLIDNILWIGTSNIIEKRGSLYKMDLSSKIPTPQKIVDHKIHLNCVADNGAEHMLIGSNSGVFELDLTNDAPTLKKVENMGNLEVRSMYKTNNDIWITTYGQGIFLYRNGNVSSFPLDKNGYLATSHCILEDNNGYFWISTNKGLFQVAKNALYDYANNKSDNVYYQYYDKGAGFDTNEFNGGCFPCGVKQSDHFFSFPSLRGIVRFNPDSIRPKLPKYGIFLDEITLDEKAIHPEGPISIDRKTERITFYLSSPHYGNAYNNLIEVKLQGKNHYNWTYTNKDNTISYTSLSPGNYTLTARKMSGFDSSYTYKTFAFRIEPAFWQTLWFRVGAVLLGAYFLYFGVQMRLRYIRYKNLLLEEKITERTSQLKSTVGTLRKTTNDLNIQVLNHKKLLASLTHDIKTPLRYLSLTGRHIYENLDDDKESIRSNAKSIYTSSFQLFQYVDNLVEYTKANVDLQGENVYPFNVYDLINDKILLFQNVLILRKITLRNEIGSKSTITLNKQLFSIVIHNLLDNAIKNTYNGTIVLNYERDKETTIITIADTGFGMLPEKLKYYQDMVSNFDLENNGGSHNEDKGLGLRIIAELLIIMNAQIKIESSLGKGTRIRLFLSNHRSVS